MWLIWLKSRINLFFGAGDLGRDVAVRALRERTRRANRETVDRVSDSLVGAASDTIDASLAEPFRHEPIGPVT